MGSEKYGKKERAQTDSSLAQERSKTDAELSKRGAGYEEITDHVVDAARQRADEVLTSALALADEKLDAEVLAIERKALWLNADFVGRGLARDRLDSAVL